MSAALLLFTLFELSCIHRICTDRQVHFCKDKQKTDEELKFLIVRFLQARTEGTNSTKKVVLRMEKETEWNKD